MRGSLSRRVREHRARAATLACVALAAALAAPVVAPGSAGAAVVAAGSLRAEATASPWHLSFTTAAGAPVLSENRGSGVGPTGTLGFSTAAGWWHATRAISERAGGGAYAAELATTDPLGRTLSVRIAPDAEGVIRLTAVVAGGVTGDVTAVGIGFDARQGERYLGFGERSNAVDQRGNTVEDYVAEGPYPPEERPFIAGIVPPWGYHPRDDAASYPVPWMLSSAGYGVLVDNPETSYFRLGSDQPGAWSVEADAAALTLRVFAGPTPARALARFTARTGRQPAPAAPWFLGAWFMPNDFDHEDVPAEIANVRRLRDADVPVSVAETTLQYLPCGDHRALRDVSQARVRAFHAAGLGILAYFHSMVCTDYDPVYRDLADRGMFARNELGQPYVYKIFADRHTQVLISQIDFTAPGSTEAFGRLVDEAVRDGYDGWMEDYGEYTPPDARFADGQTGATMHNLYPTSYHCASLSHVRTLSRPIATFVRSGWTGTAACARLVWSGDPTADWGFDGLDSAVKNGLTMGLSGVGLWASELGGLFENGLHQLTPELLIRWTELGAVSPWMKARKESIAIPPKGPRPQVWDPDVLPVFRRYAKLHTQLYPYLAAAVGAYRATGMPLMRALALVYPGDPRAAGRDDEFMFGPDLLAAPVVTQGAQERALYLPPGAWVDMWRSVAYDARTGGLALGRARILDGARDATLPAPLDELPLLARAGTLLPLLPPDVQTLTDYGAGLVKLSDRRGRMDLLAFPRGRSKAAFYNGEWLASVERRGSWTLRVLGARRRRYTLQASLATLRRPFRPCRLELGGKRVSRRRWRYYPRVRVLRATFTTRRGTLVVRRRC